MSNVNADATQLLTILKNMRTSISSIETTRSSVKMKYQQLGIGWNDKKYDELGTIVKDCNKALNDIIFREVNNGCLLYTSDAADE